MNLSLDEKIHYATYLNAGVKVYRNGEEMTLDDVRVNDSDHPPSRPASPAATSAPTPKDFAGALSLELKAGLPVKDAIRGAANKYPALYRQYCNELTDPAPSAPGPDAMPAARSNNADQSGIELARYMAAGGELRPGCPGYDSWIASFREPK